MKKVVNSVKTGAVIVNVVKTEKGAKVMKTSKLAKVVLADVVVGARFALKNCTNNPALNGEIISIKTVVSDKEFLVKSAKREIKKFTVGLKNLANIAPVVSAATIPAVVVKPANRGIKIEKELIVKTSKVDNSVVSFKNNFGFTFTPSKELVATLTAPAVVEKVRKVREPKVVATVTPVVKQAKVAKIDVVFDGVDGLTFKAAKALKSEVRGKCIVPAVEVKQAKVEKAPKVTAKPVAKVIDIEPARARRSMKQLASVVAKIEGATDVKAAKKIAKAYFAEVGEEVARRNGRFILKHIESVSAKDLFAPLFKKVA